VLVTGGNGFIGSHILNQLVDRGHEVACFDISDPSPIAAQVEGEVTFITGDVTDADDVYDAVADFEPNRLVHMAAMLGRPSERNPRRAFHVNVDGSLNVLEAAVTHDVERVVAASSSAVYGGQIDPGYDRLTESVPRDPDNVYGMSKYALEYLGSTYQEQHGVEFAAIEPVHGLGPDRRRGNVEDAFVVKAAVRGDPFEVPGLGAPYEIIYIEDEARAFVDVTLTDDVSYDRYIAGSGEQVTLAEFVEMVDERVDGADLRVVEPDETSELMARPPSDPERLRDGVGWEATHSIADAIDAYVEWLRATPDSWTFDPAEAPW
jgi:UDP-glucose 4-epimerase